MTPTTPNPIKALAVSRKFWISVIGVVTAGVAYTQHAITSDQLVTAIVGLCAVLVGSIAYEDGNKAA